MQALGNKLLDFSQPFDVVALEKVVLCMENPLDPERSLANEIMIALQNHEEAWTKVAAILESNVGDSTRFFALKLLEDAIQYRWKILPLGQKNGIKTYILNKLMTLGSNEEAMRRQKLFINKLDLILVHVLKHEWPHNWPNFIPDLVTASKGSELLAENNLTILKLLSEEIFDFSKDSMTAETARNLKATLNNEFLQIYQLCEYILTASEKPSLIHITLQTLLRFISWIPLGFIFETSLLQLLINKFFVLQPFRNDTLSCLTEIALLQNIPDQYKPILLSFYIEFMVRLKQLLHGIRMEDVYRQDEMFIQRLSIFLSAYLKNHVPILEDEIKTGTSPEPIIEALLLGYNVLVDIANLDDDDIFKICLDYFHYFTKSLYGDDIVDSLQLPNVLRLNKPLMENGFGTNHRKDIYSDVLSRIRRVMISKMVKPSEVLIVENDDGEIVKETTKDTEALTQYRTMHETLVYLTHLDYDDTENIMLAKLSHQVDGTEWSWNNLNTLCWAIGSISGAMSEEDEKRFLVTVIKDLLGLCEMKRGKDNKAVIASNIMYVVGQYPRFLRVHWKFLKTVVNKLFEFMHETHPGVQDMACETFLKIAQKCRKKFVMQQPNESQTFVAELLSTISTILSDLEYHQKHIFYEAVGSMLYAETDPRRKEEYLRALMELPNTAWKNIIERANMSPDILFEDTVMKELTRIIHTNIVVCGSIGPSGFHVQMGHIFRDMLNVYNLYSQEIKARSEKGAIVCQTSQVRSMRQTKREVLRLIGTYVETASGTPKTDMPTVIAGDNETKEIIVQHFIPATLETALTDYKSSIPNAKEVEVLVLMATCINKLRERVLDKVPAILDCVFECTLQMITKNFEDFPDHRVQFFILLQAVNEHCFQALFQIPASHQKLVVDSIIWAFKHTERNVAETGLETLHAMLLNIEKDETIASGFHLSFFCQLLQDLLWVLTDRCHKSSFKMHACILKHMFTLGATNRISVPLWTSVPGNVQNYSSNQEFLHQFVATMIAQSFPNLTRKQIEEFTAGCFDITKDLQAFKNHLRDFLVNIKEFAAENNADLYMEENQQQKAMEDKQVLEARMAVPGLVQASEKIDEMDDL